MASRGDIKRVWNKIRMGGVITSSTSFSTHNAAEALVRWGLVEVREIMDPKRPARRCDQFVLSPDGRDWDKMTLFRADAGRREGVDRPTNWGVR